MYLVWYEDDNLMVWHSVWNTYDEAVSQKLVLEDNGHKRIHITFRDLRYDNGHCFIIMEGE